MIQWTAHKPVSNFTAKGRQWYEADVTFDGQVVYATISPRRPTVSSHWGKGRKPSKSYIVYDVRIGRGVSESNFRTVALAKQFVEEYLAADGPAERAAVRRAWR